MQILVHRQVRFELREGLRHSVDPGDVEQAVLVSLFRQLPRLQFSSGLALATWLRRTVRHDVSNLVDYLGRVMRRRDREVSLDGVLGRLFHGDDGLKHAVTREVRERVRRAVEALPESGREAVRCVYFLGLSYADSAAWLGTSEHTFRSRLRRALVQLGWVLGPLR